MTIWLADLSQASEASHSSPGGGEKPKKEKMHTSLPATEYGNQPISRIVGTFGAIPTILVQIITSW